MKMPPLKVYYGGMYAGKTRALLDDIFEHQQGGATVWAVKPSCDDRYDGSAITSHDPQHHRYPSTLVDVDVDWSTVEVPVGVDVVAVDEVQFFGPSFKEWVRRRSTPVAVAGLDLDWRGHRFGCTLELLGLPGAVGHHLRAQCEVCTGPAGMTGKTTFDGDVVQVGAKELYRALCWRCWHSARVEHSRG